MLVPAQTTNEVDPGCVQILHQAYQAFNTRNIEAALSCMDVDVDWPNAMEGGYVYGHQGVRDYWARQWNMIDPTVEPLGFTNDTDGYIVVEVDQVMRDLEGNILQQDTVYHAYLILQGLIKRMEIRKKKEVLSVTDTADLPFQ